MSERIDHAAEARELLDHSVESSDKDAAIAMLHTNAAAAQAHATLALAEQQRIANLIALGEVRVGKRAAWDFDSPEPELRPEIREALGL